jgi:GT2 family glycosyltransferase
MGNNKIAVIILTWKRYEDTKDCLNSILKSNRLPDELLIIDNGSNDGSYEKIKSEFAKIPYIRFILNEDNFGFAKGVNIGIMNYLNKTGFSYLILLNQDTVVDEHFIEECFKTMKKDPEIGIVGPRIYYYNNPHKIWHGWIFFNRIKCGMIIPEKNKNDEQVGVQDRETEFLTGCAMMINKHIFKRTGLFNENFFFYFEDSDFCLKVRKAGYRLWYNSKAKVWHKITDIARDRTSPHVLYNIAKGYLIFLRSNFSFSYMLYGIFLHFVLYTPFRLWQIMNGSKSVDAIISWFKGTIDGLKMRINKTTTYS